MNHLSRLADLVGRTLGQDEDHRLTITNFTNISAIVRLAPALLEVVKAAVELCSSYDREWPGPPNGGLHYNCEQALAALDIAIEDELK